MRTLSRTLAVLVTAVVTAAAASLAPAQASAGSPAGRHGTGYTQVTVAPAVYELVAAAGITPSAIAPAVAFPTSGTLAARFPITGFTARNLTIRHSGGITLAAGAAMLWRYRLPFLVLPVAVTLWYMSMDLTPFLSGMEDAGWELRRFVSLCFGLLMVLLAEQVAAFLARNRMYEVLGLFVLLLVGVMLMSEGGHIAHLAFFGYPIEPMAKSTFYFVVVALVIVDIIQSRYQKKLLAENPSPNEDDIRWAISGNICRCTGYMNIVKAIQWAAEKNASAGEPEAEPEAEPADEPAAEPVAAG